jgi:hypothetical protein
VIRLTIAAFLVLSLFVASRGVADDPPANQPEPPVRLKKKAKPQPAATTEKKSEAPPKNTEPPKKAEPTGKDEEGKDDASAAELEQKIKELMSRLDKNLRLAEDRLNKKDTGDATQQVQRDIAKDLAELIEQTQRRQQQQQQSSSSSRSRRQQARANQMQRQDPSQRLQQEPQEAMNQRGTARGGNSKRGDLSKIADLYKDIWGHLPETLRQEMNQYSREQFMAKYNELLKQYYATIAEKGRRKGDQ